MLMITTRIIFIITLTVNISSAYAYQTFDHSYTPHTKESNGFLQDTKKKLIKLLEQIVQKFEKPITKIKHEIVKSGSMHDCWGLKKHKQKII